MQFKPENNYTDNIAGLSFGGILMDLVRNNKIPVTHIWCHNLSMHNAFWLCKKETM
jgi:hypothetical protein